VAPQTGLLPRAGRYASDVSGERPRPGNSFGRVHRDWPPGRQRLGRLLGKSLSIEVRLAGSSASVAEGGAGCRPPPPVARL